jgi:hypothetical protein|tara:strand:+ start:1123 stop:1725 length:603 start_codon:yes stop_codon:yes gene_type:complete
MSLVLEPEIGVPYSDEIPYMDLRARAEAACNTASMMKEHGLDVEPTSEDEEIAAKIILAYADDPSKTSKKVSTKRAAALPPAALIMTHNILTQFGHSVVESAVQVRHLVTNKLIEETENPDPRVRIRALELLGKISDVGLFTDKTEVTITHRTTDELRESLRSKLSKLVNLEEDVIDAEFVDPEAIDIDVELGIEDESDE